MLAIADLRGIWIFSEIDQYERKFMCKKKQSHKSKENHLIGTFLLGTHIETVLLSTQNVCFD